MNNACLPVPVPNKHRGKWSDRGRLGWLDWLLKFRSLNLLELTQRQKTGLCNNIVTFCVSYPFGLPGNSNVQRTEGIAARASRETGQ